MMHIHCLGLSHHTASVTLRERLAFDRERIQVALARMGCGHVSMPDPVSEMVILSTCNRVEVYAVAPQLAFEPLERFIAEVQRVPPGEFRPYLYCLADGEAVIHLLRVAAGLDSLVLGEPQILGQVTEALALARSQGVVGKILSRLFETAIHSGKRAHHETAISRNPTSISALAVGLAAAQIAHFPAVQVVVLGAGEMADLAVEALRKRGVSRIMVVNRTLDRAQDLAVRWGGEAATFEDLHLAIQLADILITSTGAPHTLVHAPLVASAMTERTDRPLVILDIAVPRDVDPAVASLAGVRLYDMDTLQEGVDRGLYERQREVPAVLAILAEEREAFLDYLRTLEVTPLIVEMRQRVEAIRQAELRKTLRRMPHLTPEDHHRLDMLTQALVNKILHAPIATLRSVAGGPGSVEMTTAARQIFGLNVSLEEANQGRPSDPASQRRARSNVVEGTG